ncbi:MAG: HD domain-containing protein [Bacilli bacterium]|nr:HD domain-containing protein [Bacilli bacterium]MBO7536301.1 HD domain-containing protein [Bacilli bacterium]
MKIKDYSFGSDVNDLVVRLSDVHIRKTTSGADYASMLAYDGTDTIEAKIWSFSDEIRNKLSNGEVYKVVGKFKDYQGKMQLNITDIELVGDDVDKSAFYEKAKINTEVLKQNILDYVDMIENNVLKEVTSNIISRYYTPFFNHPAAVSMHHNYISGLAYHTYSMLMLASTYIKMYSFLNSDLIYAGIILHDIGKVIELSGAKGTEYTFEGKMLGHISIGSNIIYATARDLGYEHTEEVTLLNHIVLAHHGEMEFGSPKEPLIPEALVIHLVDLSDSKLAALDKEFAKIKKGEFTQAMNQFDRKSFYYPNIDK